MIKRTLFTIFVVSVLTVLVGLTWFTQHPESPWLERAESWPVVGDLAHRFRLAYLGAAAVEGEQLSESETGAGETEVVFVDANGDPIEGPIDLTGSQRKVADAYRRQEKMAEERRRQHAADVARRRGSPGEAHSTTTRPSSPDTGAATGRGERLASGDRPMPDGQRVLIVPSGTPGGTSRGTAEGEGALLGRETTIVDSSGAPSIRPVEQRGDQQVGSSRRPSAGRRNVSRRDPLPFVAREWRWIRPGNQVRARASEDAETIARLPALAHVPVLDQDGAWFQVVYQGRQGWVDSAWQPPYSRRKARRGILRQHAEPVRTPDLARRARARKQLGLKKSKRKLGPYELFTDVQDETLLAFLDQAAGMAEDAYYARFGRLPSGDPLRSAVIFAREADYRIYAETADLPLDRSTGHAGGGVLAFYAEGKDRGELAATLVHEITHLLNDRALAWSLPPWLEEGLATDLGSLWVEPDTAASGGASSYRITGIDSRLLYLDKLAQEGKLPFVTKLLTLDREGFYQENGPSASYALGAAFIRFMLESEHADGFRAFLKKIADGMGANLLKQLDIEPVALERAFRQWLGTEVQRTKDRLGIR